MTKALEEFVGVHPELASKIAVLDARLSELGSVVVAFSGGADSAFLAAAAHRALGTKGTHCITAVSPSLAGDEAEDCRLLAAEWGLRWTPVVTHEMERAAYRINDIDRCFHCKAELMDVVTPIASIAQATVVLGVNVDDLGDHRPGQQAAKQAGAQVLMGGEKLGATTYAPTVLLRPPLDARVSRQEIFGPVVCVYEHETIDDAIAQANDLPFAFQASVYSNNLDMAMKAIEALDATAVMVNDHTAFRVDWMPFAGRKQSGYGTGGIGYTMHDMTQEKMAVIKF